MSRFYGISDTKLKRDLSLIKKLEMKQRQLEERANMAEELRKFRAHPKRIFSDSDTTASNTPRLMRTQSSRSLKRDREMAEYQKRKQMAEHVRKKLHEKLSIIDQNPSEKTDFSAIGDFDRSLDRFQNRRQSIDNNVHTSSCSLSSIESDRRESIALSKNKTPSKANNNCSAASRPDRKSSAGSRVSLMRAGLSASTFEKKFKIIAEKSLQSISEIKDILARGIVPPDGEEDESRRAVRVKEFSNRFSRNYLYPLARQLTDLNGANILLDSSLLNQKLLSAYQLAQNGLQAYQSHLPASVGDCSFTQLKILMSNIVGLCSIHRDNLKKEEENYVIDFIDTLKIQAELTNQKIDEYQTKPAPSSDSALKSEQTKLSLTRYGEAAAVEAKKNTAVKRNRFSMYTSTAAFRKDAPWKRAVENLAKKRFNVKSKYKTATYKHRPPVQKEAEPTAPLPKLVQHKSAGGGRPTQLTTPLNEDRIQTMVEVEGGNHLEKEEWENMEKREKNETDQHQHSTTEEILIKLLQFTLKSHNKEAEEKDRSRLAELVALVKREPNTEVLKRVLDGIDDGEKENVDNQQLTLEIVNRSQSSLTSGGKLSNRREPKITVSGEKNAKLICITDDNSIVEPLEDHNKVMENEDAKNNLGSVQTVTKTTSETQTAIERNENCKKKAKERIKKNFRKKQTVKISRLKKAPGKPLKHLDRGRAVDIIQYKLDFYRHCKNNPLYRRSTACQPCEMMNRISEDLLSECLLAVAGEIEVNDIVEKVYHSELQL